MRSREFSRVATMTRATPAESSTPATSGPLGPTVRAPGALAAVTSPVQTLAHRNPCLFDGFGQLFGLAATGRRVVDATTALSAEYRGHLLHELVRIERRGQILRDRYDECRLPVPPRAEHDRARPDRRADPIGQGAQVVDVGVPDVGRDQLGAPEQLRSAQ